MTIYDTDIYVVVNADNETAAIIEVKLRNNYVVHSTL